MWLISRCLFFTVTAYTCDYLTSLGSAITALSIDHLKAVVATEFEKCFDVLGQAKFSAAQFEALAESAQQVKLLQYRHLIPAPFHRTSASVRLYKQPWIRCQKSQARQLPSQLTSESKLHLAVRSFMHLCPVNWLVIWSAVVYYTWAVHAFSAEINVGTVCGVQQ